MKVKMKKFSFLSVSLLALVCFMMSGCHDKSKGNGAAADSSFVDRAHDRDMVRTAADTATIIKICTDYLDLLKEGKMDDAVNMLYSFDKSTHTVSPITAEQREKVVRTHKMFPVLNYSLESMRLYAEDDTEFVFMVEFFEKPEGDTRPNTVREALSPVRVDGQWYLTIAGEINELREER